MGPQGADVAATRAGRAQPSFLRELGLPGANPAPPPRFRFSAGAPPPHCGRRDPRAEWPAQVRGARHLGGREHLGGRGRRSARTQAAGAARSMATAWPSSTVAAAAVACARSARCWARTAATRWAWRWKRRCTCRWGPERRAGCATSGEARAGLAAAYSFGLEPQGGPPVVANDQLSFRRGGFGSENLGALTDTQMSLTSSTTRVHHTALGLEEGLRVNTDEKPYRNLWFPLLKFTVRA